MTTFDDVLARIRGEAKNKRDLGDRFEKITRDFLKTDRHYASRFSKVWLWKEWPDNDGPDTGIDLVAEERDDGKLCAIQCKCYNDDGSLDMKSVAKFLAKAASLRIPNSILVYTGDTLTSNTDKILRDSGTTMLRHEHFRDGAVDWSKFPKLEAKKPNKLRDHQKEAHADVLKGFEKHDRGQMIMACGTGKTMTALHIAEKQAGVGGTVLYVVPSISLVLQSMREWSQNRNIPHRYAAVCSDSSTGDDSSITELEIRASTDVPSLKEHLKDDHPDKMTVVFSTYHSLDVVKKSVKGGFDIIFCDEAHRTTGVEDKSFFTTIHSDKNIRGGKRLYMTATPRVYSDVIKAKMGRVIHSMDDEGTYGPEFHNLSFTKAVKDGILTDFRVKIVMVPEDAVDKEFQQSVSSNDSEMPLDERSKMAAVWHALLHPDDDEHPRLLQRVIAFANRIDRSMMFAGMITDGNDANRSFANVVDAYAKKKKSNYKAEVKHIDGKSKALERRNHMKWLDSSASDPNTCRILSNAKCLSEGVDVPALDGVIFLNPRKSRVDVVQSVGRVMRKSPGKDYGYVILPVALPAGREYHESLNDNKTFQIVWQVLSALRSHDENFGAEINRLILDQNTENTNPTPRISISVLGRDGDVTDPEIITEFFDKVKSKLVEKVGDINYYDKYGQQLGEAALRIEARIRNRIKTDKSAKAVMAEFHSGLKKVINDQVTEDATIQVMAQHIVLSKVFDLLFQGQFSSNNPISAEFEKAASEIGMSEELEKLEGFYEDVEREVSGIDTGEARQSFIKKIYGNFLQSVDKKGSEKHGIVYTPVEVIDFILNSVQHVLKTEFHTNFDDRTVKVLEPFVGTGTFLTRLLDPESGLISDDAVYEKYKHGMHANEIVLLAYYIAAVNIETTYQSRRRGHKYVPFTGINYTDTLTHDPRYREDKRHRERQDVLEGAFKNAHERIRSQRFEHLHVIVGNPPYSAGQSNYNDQNQNVDYPRIDERIKDTYLDKARTVNPKIGLLRSLYDSYIRSIRWASDRIGESGIIGFVTNGSFIKTDAAVGLRACLQEEFTDVWVFDLSGNARTSGEARRKEGGNVFGMGSRAPVAITILVKNPKKKGCTIHYKDIGDYLTQKQKLDTIRESESIKGIQDWEIITPDKHQDWLDQRVDFPYTSIGSKQGKKGTEATVFETYSSGLKTQRDVWAYNSSIDELSHNMKIHIDYCNKNLKSKPKTIDVKQVKWTLNLSLKLKQGGKQTFNQDKIRTSLYRPFFKQYVYFDKVFNEVMSHIPKFFPNGDSENIVIAIPDKGKSGMFSSLVADITPDLHVIEQSQIFPFYAYKDSDPRERERERERGRAVENLVIIVPYKYTGDPSVIITDTTPDIQVNFNGQVFPFYYYREGRLRRENGKHYGSYARGIPDALQ